MSDVVFRVVETTRDALWKSRPYETLAAANNRASRLNNEAQRFAQFYENFLPRHYVVEFLEGNYERVSPDE